MLKSELCSFIIRYECLINDTSQDYGVSSHLVITFYRQFSGANLLKWKIIFNRVFVCWF